MCQYSGYIQQLITFQEILQAYLVLVLVHLSLEVLTASQGLQTHFVPEGLLGLMPREHGLLLQCWKHTET